MSDLLFEDMIRVETKTHVCRMWRQLDGPPGPGNATLKHLALELMQQTNLGLKEIVSMLADVERINSVEIIDRVTGDGVCVHKNWP